MIIIFDLDGTLFQTALCDIAAVNHLFDELAIEKVDDTAITYNIGKKTFEFLTNILPAHIKQQDVYDRFRELEQKEVRENGILFPGVIELFEELVSKGHTLIICSNGSSEYIELVLKKTGITKYFSNIYSAKEANNKGEVIRKILDNNSPAVVIGDTLSDIEAAAENNIPSIAAMYGYGNINELGAATYIIQNVTDIIGYVNRIEIFYTITDRSIRKGKKVIGINGVDTSGKTVFTKAYSKFLSSLKIKNTIIHIDDYHNPAELRCKGDNEIEAYYHNAFNYDQVIDEILGPLNKLGSIDKDILCLNLDTNKYENFIHYNIDENTIVLIEGVLLFREPLLKYLDTTVFLHIDFDEVLRRMQVRDVPKYGEGFIKKYTNKYIPVQRKYLEEYRPEQRSDIVINNQDYFNPRLGAYCKEKDDIYNNRK